MLTTLLLSLLLLQTDAVQQRVEPTEFEQKLLDATNAERIKAGVKPLEFDPQLQTYARSWTAYMTRTGNFRHSNYGVGENIAAGQRTIPEVMRSWMNSSGHRANILNPRYKFIGTTGYSGSVGYKVYWTQCFR